MNEVDKRVVQMEFDNSKFEKNIDQTMKTLEDLNKMLQMRDASKGFDTLVGDSDKLARSMSYVGESVDEVKFKLSTLQVVGYTVLSELTKTAIKVGNKMASAVWSPIVSGGARRAQNIEAAKFQLEGLGVAWKDISEDINYGVKDTAYGLDSAARVAAQLVASNIKPGELMRDTLRGISGVAAMTNSSYDEIGSIFTTVAGNNKLMTMQLRQLSYRGLNAAATLGNYLGKTEQEIYEMVSKGKIDFETFAAAMDEAFGDHAKEANKTFSGAMSNVRAALSRVGAKFADPVYDTLRQVFVALIPVINGVNRIIDPVVDGFSNFLSLLRISTTSLLTEDFSKAIGALFLDIYSWIRPLIGALVKVGVLGRDLNGVGTGLLGVLSKLQLYGPAAEKVEHFIIGIFGVIKLIFSIIKSGIIIIKPIIEAVVFGLGKIFGISGDLGQVLWGVSNVLSVLIQKLAKFISLKIERVLGVIFGVLSRIDLNKVAKGIVVIVNILGVVTKAIILLSKVTFILIAGVISSIPLLINSLTNVFGTIGSIYDAFTSKIASIFGGKKRTAELEVNTTVNGPTAFEMLQDHILTEELLSENEATQKHIEQNEKNMNRAAESMKNFGEVSKKTAHDVQKNAQAIRSAAASASDAAKETTDTWEDLTRRVHVKNTDKKFNEEEAVSQNPLVRFFIAVRNGIIFAAASLVRAVITAVSWVADAIGKAFPALGRLGNAVMDKLADFVENFGSLESWLQGIEFLVFGIIASIVAILMSISTLIGGAGLYMGGLGVAAALAAFESAIFSILAFLTAVALITELIDLDKFERTIDILKALAIDIMTVYGVVFGIVKTIGLATSILDLISSFTKKGKVVETVVGATNVRQSPLFAVASIINSLAFGLLAVVGALIIIDKVLPDNMKALFNKSLWVIGTAAIGLGAILFAIGAFAKITQLSMASSTGSMTGFGGLRDVFGSGANPVYSHTTTSENGLGGIIGLITGIGFYIAAVTLALKVISTMKTGEILKGGAVIGGALLAIAGVIAIIGLAYKKVDKEWNKDIIDQGIDNTRQKGHGKIYTKTDTTRNSGNKHTMASSLEGVAGAISAIGGYILRITLAMKVIGKMSWKEIRKGSSVLAGALLAIGILLPILAKFTKTIDNSTEETSPVGLTNRSDNKKTVTNKSKTESNMEAVANAIKAISKFLLAVTASVVILSQFRTSSLWKAVGVLTVMTFLVTVAVMVLANLVMYEKQATAIEKILGLMSVLILAIGASLSLMANAIDKNDLNGLKVGLILGALTIFGLIAYYLIKAAAVPTINFASIIAVTAGMVGVMLAIGGMFLMISHSNLEKMNRTFKKALLPLLITVGVILGALILLATTATSITALEIGAIITIMASISVFLIALAGAMKLMSTANLDLLSNNIWTIVTIIGLAVALFAVVAIVASQEMAKDDVIIAAGVMVVVALFFKAIADAITVLAGIDSEKLEATKDNLLTIMGVAAIIFALLAIFSSVPAIGPTAILSTAAAFAILAAGVIGIALAINMLADSDMDNVTTAADAMTQVLLSLGGAALMIGGAIALATGAIGGLAMAAAAALPVLGVVAAAVAAVGATWYFGYHPEDDWDVNPGWDLSDFPGATEEDVKPHLAGEIDYENLPWSGSASDYAETAEYTGEIADDMSSAAESSRVFSENISNVNNSNNPAVIAMLEQYQTGAASIGNAYQLNTIRRSGINLASTLVAGFMTSISSSKKKVESAISEIFKAPEMTSTKDGFSNMSKVLDEYGNSITKNIVSKNREAIETTKELSNALNNSSESMKSFSKSTGSGSNLAILSKEMSNFNKEATDISYDREKIAQDGYEVGKAHRDGMIKGFDLGETADGLVSWLIDTISSGYNAASSYIEDQASSWVENITGDNLNLFGDMGDTLGSYAGMVGGEQMMEMFGIYTQEYYEKLAAQAAQKITASERALSGVQQARQSAILQFGRQTLKLKGSYEDVISRVTELAEAHPDSMIGLEYARIMRQYDQAEANNQAQIATQRGAYEAAMEMANATIYEKLGLGDIGDLFDNLPTGTPSDYTNDAASAIANSSGSGSGINDSSIGGPGSTNINSNNTYNFTQNNYSPEALSRSDLYMQTRAQINAWYGWMRGQPAT